MKALSIKQPWAWLIVNGYKDVENRTWKTKFRGRFLIHAGKTVDHNGFIFAKEMGIQIPTASALRKGGIVGSAVLFGCVMELNSPWFFGPYGWILEDVVRYDGARFIPYKGRLNFFEVRL